MITFLNIIFILWGVYLFFFSLIGAEGNFELMAERNYTCPEKFLSKQKLCDCINGFHCFCVSLMGAFMTLKGITHFNGIFGLNWITIQTIALCILLLDTVVSNLIFNKAGLKELMKDIKSQWEKEKKITKEHDDEVRYYRQAKSIDKITQCNLGYLFIFLAMMLIP